MGETPLILVLTQHLDAHADLVIRELHRRHVPVVRFDTAAFPQHATFTARQEGEQWQGTLLVEEKTLALEQITSIWYRRPTPFEPDTALSLAGHQFASAEARMGVGGVLRSLPCLWVNHPEKMVTADYKPWQLQVAQECGLEVPRSLITNEPEAVHAFLEECHGKMVYKTLSGGCVMSEDDEPISIYTSQITAEDMQREHDRVRMTACLFQEQIEKKVELRVTIVGEQLFPAEISYLDPEKAALDWRTAYRICAIGLFPYQRSLPGVASHWSSDWTSRLLHWI